MEDLVNTLPKNKTTLVVMILKNLKELAKKELENYPQQPMEQHIGMESDDWSYGFDVRTDLEDVVK